MQGALLPNLATSGHAPAKPGTASKCKCMQPYVPMASDKEPRSSLGQSGGLGSTVRRNSIGFVWNAKYFPAVDRAMLLLIGIGTESCL